MASCYLEISAARRRNPSARRQRWVGHCGRARLIHGRQCGNESGAGRARYRAVAACLLAVKYVDAQDGGFAGRAEGRRAKSAGPTGPRLSGRRAGDERRASEGAEEAAAACSVCLVLAWCSRSEAGSWREPERGQPLE